ncbi:hypothetical protein [Nesterenkonia ebinurensis]|uniref:hypothetical protein n=1 Tax=Nesterenkonia ebinurensis TaxID=2608252 RepID=UPI00168BD9D6|nr:hypothetical protein [Nesterenkonia ebinurensis]
MLAHNILYTYITPFLAPLGMGQRVDAVLLAFGLSSGAIVGEPSAHIDTDFPANSSG